MNFKKVLSIASVASLAVVGLVSCAKKEKTTDADGNYIGKVNASLTYKNIGYMTYGRGTNSANMDKTYETVDGRTLTANKTIAPIWQDIGTNNNVKFQDAALDGETTAASMSSAITAKYKGYKNRKIDLLQITSNSDFTDAVNAGGFVNLSKYLDQMPNLNAWLKAHPAMKEQLTLNKGSDSEGIYYTPYFDGLDQVEKGFNMNIDIAKALLDEENQQTTESKLYYNQAKTGYDTDEVYKDGFAYDKPYIASIDKDIAVAKKKAADASKSETEAGYEASTVHVKIDAGQDIITLQKDAKTGAQLVQILKDYIDAHYSEYIGEGKLYASRSELFTSTSACYNADELIALLRCVKANPKFLAGVDDDGKAKGDMIPVFPRTAESNRASIFYEISQIFGNRGTNGEKDRLWLDADGKLVDGRTQSYSLYCLSLMRELQVDKLFPTNTSWQRDGKTPKGDYRSNELSNGFAFMTYDYNNVAAYNYDKTGKGKCYNCVGVLPPYARWAFTKTDGSNSSESSANAVVGADNGYSYTRFSEDDRSLKDGGWSITAKYGANNEAKLKKLLQIMDYLYTPEGSVLECFGYNAQASAETKAKAWVKRSANETAAKDLVKKTATTDEYLAQDADGNWYVNFADSFKKEQVAKTAGTWHNFMTMYWGSCLGVGNVRSNYLEGQLTGTRQTVASKKYSNASSTGAFYLAKTSGSGFLKVVPTVVSYTSAQSTANTSGAKSLMDWWNIAATSKENALWTSQMLNVVYSGWSTSTLKSPAAVEALFEGSNNSYLSNTATQWSLTAAPADHYTYEAGYATAKASNWYYQN